jgi:hypothetical protein
MVGLYVINRSWLLPSLQQELGITSNTNAIVALEALKTLPEDIATLSTSINQFQAFMQAATGETRLIRQTPGTTYISDPVYIDSDYVVYNTEFNRTNLGLGCTLTDSQSIFSDENNSSYNGGKAQPQRQVGPSPMRVRSKIDLPKSDDPSVRVTPLEPGRVEMRMILIYDCNGKARTDEAERVSFTLLPALTP